MQHKFHVRTFPIFTLKMVVAAINVRNGGSQYHGKFQEADSVVDYEKRFATHILLLLLVSRRRFALTIADAAGGRDSERAGDSC